MADLSGKQKLDLARLKMTLVVTGAMFGLAILLLFSPSVTGAREFAFGIFGAILGFWLK